MMRKYTPEYMMKDPDKRAKIFLLVNIAMIATTFLITIGMIIFILMLVGVF